jgi:hypothetical protein
LKKCFDKGLRKEWIMSEEEKRTKKQKIEDNRRLRAMSQNSTMFSFTPSSSPPIVPETEGFNFPNEYQKQDDDDDYKTNIHLFEDTNDILDIKPFENKFNQTIFDYTNFLNNNDRQLLINVEKNYTRAVQLNVSVIRGYDFPCLRNLNDITDVVNEPAQMSSIRIITFLKLTPEFHVRFSYSSTKIYLIFF